MLLKDMLCNVYQSNMEPPEAPENGIPVMNTIQQQREMDIPFTRISMEKLEDKYMRIWAMATNTTIVVIFSKFVNEFKDKSKTNGGIRCMINTPNPVFNPAAPDINKNEPNYAEQKNAYITFRNRLKEILRLMISCCEDDKMTSVLSKINHNMMTAIAGIQMILAEIYVNNANRGKINEFLNMILEIYKMKYNYDLTY